MLFLESYNLDSNGNDIPLNCIVNQAGLRYICDEIGVAVLSEDISWGVDLSSFCLFTLNGVRRADLSESYFCSWLTDISSECFGFMGPNEILVNDDRICVNYYSESNPIQDNIMIEINGDLISFMPDDYGLIHYWSDYMYLFYDEENTYIAIKYNGDWDEDRFLALYRITEEGVELIQLEDNESMQNPIQDVFDIIEFGQLK